MEIIQAVVGRVIRTVEQDGNVTSGKEYTIVPKAKVTLNDKKVTLAALSNGDAVQIGGGTKEGYKVVTAVRDTSKPPVVRSGSNLSTARPVELVHQKGATKPVWVPEGSEESATAVADTKTDTFPKHVTSPAHLPHGPGDTTETSTSQPTTEETVDAEEGDKKKGRRGKH